MAKNNQPIEKIFKEKQVVIFGAGRLGLEYSNTLKKNKIKVISFIDNNKNLNKIKFNGIPVIDINDARKKYRDYPVIIASTLYGNEIYKILKSNSFKYIYPLYYLNIKSKLFEVPDFKGVFNSLFVKQNQKNINKIYKILKEKESVSLLNNIINFRLTGKSNYIDSSFSKYNLFKEKLVCPLSKNEIFVDCGAYDGDTIKMFGDATKWNFDQIYAFEPDIKNFVKMKNWARDNNLKNITLIKEGVYNVSGNLSFNNNGTVDSKIIKKANKINSNFITVTSLDEFFNNRRPPTLVKMDIEGSEIPALQGMKHVIKSSKPKLAISIYHKPSDLWRIILLIKSYNKDYKFYLRHFTKEYADTMCFAI